MDTRIFSSVGSLLAQLKECSTSRNLRRGREIHARAVKAGNGSCLYVANSLVNMYAKCGSMAEAQQVFDGILQPNVVSWNALILGYAEDGETALGLYDRMRSQGHAPNSRTFIAVLKACTSLASKPDGAGKMECRQRGKEIHSKIGPHCDIYVQNTLMNMYAKCGCMSEARQVFERIEHPNVVSWTALVLGYAENGEGFNALQMLSRMRHQGLAPDSVMFVAALKACTCVALENDEFGRQECLKRGREIQSEISGHPDVKIQSALIEMYAKCGSMIEARQVFDHMENPSVVSWTALMTGYLENGESEVALDLFYSLKSGGGIVDTVAFSVALQACGFLCALEEGRRIHSEVDSKCDVILVACLIDFYSKCGCVAEAQQIFDSHSGARNMVTWNALLNGYSRLGDSKAVFELVDRMQAAGYQPDGFTLLCILTCCNHGGLIKEAMEAFEVMTCRFTPTVEHCNCIVDILGRSNKLDDAVAFLRDQACRPSVVTWMTLLDACRKWKNPGVGTLAFRSMVSLEDSPPSAAYVLMGHIYESRGMWEEQGVVFRMRTRLKPRKEVGQSSWTDGQRVHSFVVNAF